MSHVVVTLKKCMRVRARVYVCGWVISQEKRILSTMNGSSIKDNSIHDDDQQQQFTHSNRVEFNVQVQTQTRIGIVPV